MSAIDLNNLVRDWAKKTVNTQQERSEMKRQRGGSKLPRKITVEQRNEIIRFIRTRTDIVSRNDRLKAAIDTIAPGKLSIPHSSGATVMRWYGYIGKPAYDPDAALQGAQSGQRRGLTTEQQDQVTAYMQAHKDEYPSQVLCLQSAVDVLNVPLTVNSFNANTYLHRKLKAPVTIPAVGPLPEPVGKLATNSKHGKEVRDQVSAWMHEHVKEFDTKVELFKAAVEQFGLKIIPNSSGAFSYWNRLTKNAAARNGKAKEVQIIILNGHEYTDTELEEILKEHRNAVQPVRFCPECGFRMELHNKAYTIAQRHQQE